MKNHVIHQLLHGYRNGHQMLAGSLRLKGDAADLVDRLSDLSGAVIPNSRIDPYLTLYPIPDAGYYAVANTWVDPAGPRTGCVLTHTLLVPSQLWSTDPDPSWLAACLTGPATHSGVDEYKTPLEVPVDRAVVQRPASTSVPTAERLFVQRFFGEGMRPIVWFDCAGISDILWSITRFLWPAMREVFTSSTHCLQPRIASDGPFHVMFAPSAARPRFQQFPVQAFIPDSANTVPQIGDANECWVEELTNSIFKRDFKGHFHADMMEFAPFLDAEPTAIRRVFLVSDLKARLDVAPTAGIGLLDMIEALMPQPETGTGTKTEAVSGARAAASRCAPEEALRCLFLLSDRLRRPAFRSVNDAIAAGIRKDVRDIVFSLPDIAISEQTPNPLSSIAEAPSAYLDGVLDGLELIAQARPADLVALCKNDELAITAIQSRPSIAQAIMSSKVDASAKTALASWIRAIRRDEARASLREFLFSKVVDESGLPVLLELLTDVDAQAVPSTLEMLSSATRGFDLISVRRMLREHVSERFPEATRAWATSTDGWSKGAAELVAATFPQTLDGMLSLLDYHGLSSVRYVEVWAAFLAELGAPHLPHWLVRYAATNGVVVIPFVQASSPLASDVAERFEQLLKQCQYMPLVHEPHVLGWLNANEGVPGYDLLVDQTVRSIVREFTVGKLGLEQHSYLLGREWASRWVKIAPSAQVIQQATFCENAASWERCWISIANMPDVVYERSPAVMPDIVRALLRSHVAHWTSAAAENWQTIIIRAKAKADRGVQLALCADALRFCFKYNYLTLGNVVADAFPLVYLTVANSSEPPPETADLFAYYDWDKAKTLRKDLIKAFRSSDWNPGDLAVAASQAGLIRKLYNRLRRSWNGKDYLDCILADLRGRRDEESTSIANAIQAIVDDPYFYEPWD